MKKTFGSLMILIAFYAMPALAATTVTGTVTDDMCGAKHMANDKTYILAGKTAEVDALAGQKATVTGDLKGNTLTVTSIAAAK